MTQRQLQELLGRRCDRCIARGDVFGESAVINVEFGDVDIDAESGQLMQEFVEPRRIMRILRLQMTLQADDVKFHAGMFEVGDEL